VVGLVLHAAGHQPGADHLDRVAVPVESLRHDVHPALGVEVEAGDGQAALRAVLLLVVRERENRVDQMPDHVVNVEREDPQPDAELRSGKAGAALILHGLGEVLDQRAELAVEVHDGLRGRTQHGVPEQSDRLNGHVRSSSCVDFGLTGPSHQSTEPTSGRRRNVSGLAALVLLRWPVGVMPEFSVCIPASRAQNDGSIPKLSNRH
jgi:hypothetical protein